MANNNFTVRAGHTVCLGAPNSNGPGATVFTAGQQVSLSDAQVENHLHKLEPFDAGAITKLSGISGRVHVGASNVY